MTVFAYVLCKLIGILLCKATHDYIITYTLSLSTFLLSLRFGGSIIQLHRTEHIIQNTISLKLSVRFLHFSLVQPNKYSQYYLCLWFLESFACGSCQLSTAPYSLRSKYRTKHLHHLPTPLHRQHRSNHRPPRFHRQQCHSPAPVLHSASRLVPAKWCR